MSCPSGRRGTSTATTTTRKTATMIRRTTTTMVTPRCWSLFNVDIETVGRGLLKCVPSFFISPPFGREKTVFDVHWVLPWQPHVADGRQSSSGAICLVALLAWHLIWAKRHTSPSGKHLHQRKTKLRLWWAGAGANIVQLGCPPSLTPHLSQTSHPSHPSGKHLHQRKTKPSWSQHCPNYLPKILITQLQLKLKQGVVRWHWPRYLGREMWDGVR